MRRLFFSIFTLIFVSAYSQPVSVSDVESVVKRFLPSRYDNADRLPEISIADITPVSDQNGVPVWFAVNLEPSGWVMVSARKEAFPVLAYSFKGRYTGRNFPESFEAWVEQYEKAIAGLQTGFREKIAMNEAWQPDHNFGARSRDLTPVQPFVNTSWDQGWPYNESCPPDPASGDGRCPTGCVPTAMAQVMFYYRWPVTGTGSYTYDAGEYGILSADFGATTYDWNSMGMALKHSSPSAATLLSQLGISCDLIYGPTGSGMYCHKAAYSLRTYFKYSPDTRYVFRDSTNLRWDSLLMAQLDRHMPLYYAGWSVPNVNGHAFVCDGYQDTAFFHFNFGWSGSYDGYFNINQLYVGGSNFNLAQEVIVDCYPDTVNYTYPPQVPESDTLSLYEGSGSDGSAPLEFYQPGTSLNWLIDPQTDIDSVESVTLQFYAFDLGNADIVTVYDGKTNQSPVLASVTGQHDPFTVTSTGNAVLITFEANGSTPGEGFVFGYEAKLPVWCSGTKTYTQASGELSDGSGRFYYYDKSKCIWKIQPTGATTVTLYIDAFSTEPVNDYMRVLDLGTGDVLGELSGTYNQSNLPEPMVATGGKMMILFSTNDSVRDDGFRAHWEANNVGTGNLNTAQELTLWPNPCHEKLVVGCSCATGDYTVEVYDLSGRRLMLPVIRENGENSIMLDLTGINAGYYQLAVRRGDQILRGRFVKL